MSPDLERRTLNSVSLDTLAGASVEEANSLTGELIGGILEVGELLGKGGMGVVYQVFHREWNRQADDGGALEVAQKEKEDDNGEDAADDGGVEDFIDRLLDKGRLVEDDFHAAIL